MTHGQQRQRILVLGGGYAGMIAAARIARESAAEVTLVDAKADFVQRIRLHEILAGGAPRTLPYAPLLKRRSVRFLQARVEELDLKARRAVASRIGGGRLDLEWDVLVYALGSGTAAGVPGVAEHAVRIDGPGAAAAARDRLQALPSGRVLVAGGGLTGIETATELAERYPHLHVVLATRGRLGDGYSAAGREHLRARFQELGIGLIEEAGIAALESGRALLEGGGAEPFDLAFWCGGFAVPGLAREAGLPVDASGRIRVDAGLRALGHPNVFAAGDAAAALFAGGRTVRMGCVSALPTGAQAGENVRRLLRGEEAEPFDMAFAIHCISLGRRNALVQFTAADDTPRDRVLTGRPAVWVKEAICRMTLAVVHGEMRTGLALYRWPRSKAAAAVAGPTERRSAA